MCGYNRFIHTHRHFPIISLFLKHVRCTALVAYLFALFLYLLLPVVLTPPNLPFSCLSVATLLRVASTICRISWSHLFCSLFLFSRPPYVPLGNDFAPFVLPSSVNILKMWYRFYRSGDVHNQPARLIWQNSLCYWNKTHSRWFFLADCISNYDLF